MVAKQRKTPHRRLQAACPLRVIPLWHSMQIAAESGGRPLRTSRRGSDRVFLDAASDDPEPSVWKRPLQLQMRQCVFPASVVPA